MDNLKKPQFYSPRAGSRGMDELQFAAYCGDIEAVRFFIANGADVTTIDDSGYTALHWNVRMACAGGGDRNEIILELIAAGADVNHRDHGGNSVLDSALEATASEAMIAQLKAHGAESYTQRTP